MKKPNFFIVGAPKSGTTAMAAYLAEHPQVFFSVPKEPHYFATDMPGQQQMNTPDRYQILFNAAGEQHKRVGEASVWYLHSTEAMANIKAHSPDAKIVVMLRKPVEMVYSMHAQHLYSTTEHITDFSEAWDFAETRKATGSVNRETALQNHFYDEIAAYGTQLERVYAHFPQSQVKVILFDDFKQDTARCYRELLAFLDLDDDQRSDFPVINANNEHRFKWLGRLLQKPPAPVVNGLRMVKGVLGINRLGVIGKLDAMNAQDVKREALSEEVRRKVVDHYKPEMDKLAGLLGRDLSAWQE